MSTTHLSIQSRLSRVVMAVSLAWSLTVFALVWWAIHRQLDDVLDSALQESAEIMVSLLKSQPALIPHHQDEDARVVLPAALSDERMAWQLVAPDGHLLWRSHRAPKVPLRASRDKRYTHDGTEWHVHSLPLDAQGTTLHVAQPHLDRSAAQWRAALATSGGTLLVGLVCAIWLQRRVKQELQPLVELSAAVDRYQPMAPPTQPPQVDRAELVPLRQAIVQLGERLAQAVISERAFSAHAAHALRTPLAGLSAQLATAQKTAPPELQPRLQRAREAADRLSRVVSALLALFRAGSQPHRHHVHVAELVQQLPIQGLRIDHLGNEALVAAVDPDLLAGALLNLLDNCVRHGAQSATLQWQSEADGSICLTLTDDGPGVSVADTERLNQALQHQHYEQNMGLGLMLADRVARAHGGSLRILQLDTGFGVSLTLHQALNLALNDSVESMPSR